MAFLTQSLRTWILNSLSRDSPCLSFVVQTCYNTFCRLTLAQAGVATSALNFCCFRENLFDIWLGFRTVCPLKGNFVEEPIVTKAVNEQTQTRTLPGKGRRYTNSLKTLRAKQVENIKSIMVLGFMTCCICTGFKTSSLSICKVSPTVNLAWRGGAIGPKTNLQITWLRVSPLPGWLPRSKLFVPQSSDPGWVKNTLFCFPYANWDKLNPTEDSIDVKIE